MAALHYLIKPVDDEKLQGVLERAKKEIEKKQGLKNRQFIHLFLTLLFIALLYVFSEIGYIVSRSDSNIRISNETISFGIVFIVIGMIIFLKDKSNENRD